MVCVLKLPEAVEIESPSDLNLITHLLLKAKLQTRTNTFSKKCHILYPHQKKSLFFISIPYLKFYTLKFYLSTLSASCLLSPLTN